MRSGSAPRWHLNKMLVHRSSSCCRDVSGSNGTLNGSLCSCLSISSEFIPDSYCSLDVRSATITAGGFMPNPGMLHRLVKLARWVLSLSLSPRSNTFYRQSRDHSQRPRTHTHTITDIRMQCIGAQAATLLLYAHVAYPEQACFKSPVVPVRGNSCTRERPTLARQDETLDVTA
jgi:hypothetical protein